MTKIDNFIRLFERTAEAMKHAAQFSRIRAHDFECVVPRIALMNHEIEAEFKGEIELLLKETCLSRLVGAILDARFDFLFSFALEGARKNLHLLFLGRGHARSEE